MLHVLYAGVWHEPESTEKSEPQSNPSGIQTAARRDFSEDSMKRVFLLIVVPALLVAMGFAQVSAASGSADQMNVKGCVGGSDGNYTVLENNTSKTFKITTSSTDLKAYVGQDVNLTGHKAGNAENSLAVTELNMISVHCTAATAAPAVAVSTPAETVSTPAAADAAAAPAAAASDAAVSSPPETIIERPTPAAPAAAAPAATVSTPSETIGTPPAAPAAALTSTVSTPAETANAPAEPAAVHRTRPSARAQKPAATPTAARESSEPVSKPVADAAVPTAPVSPPSDAASTPAVPAVPATTASTSKSAGMLVSIVVVVLLIGTAVPFYNRWRKRRLLEQTRGQNLSFTKETKSDPGKSDTTGGHKAA
jgi:hypothetical protein